MNAIGSRLRWVSAIGTAAAGIVLKDCLVIAAAGPLALWAFYATMNAQAPTDAFRAAVRTASAGAVSLLAGMTLALATFAAIHGVWQPAHDEFLAGAMVLAASIVGFAAIADNESPSARSVFFWLAACVAFVSIFALVVVTLGNAWSLCALPLATAALLVLVGWRLLSEVATGILEAGLRR